MLIFDGNEQAPFFTNQGLTFISRFATMRNNREILLHCSVYMELKDFTDAQVDTMEILLEKLYAQRGITDSTDFSQLTPIQYPVMAEFYWLCQKEYLEYDPSEKHLYTQEMLREICLGIHSMCVGTESRYFNGHTNIVDDKFLCFGVKGLMDTNKRLKDVVFPQPCAAATKNGTEVVQASMAHVGPVLVLRKENAL